MNCWKCCATILANLAGFVCAEPSPTTTSPNVVMILSDDLVCLVDLAATAAAVAGEKLTNGAAPDSFNLLPTLLGQPNPTKRDSLVVMSGKGDLALRQGQWKYLPDLAVADGWEAGVKKPGAPEKPALYDLSKDQGETENLIQKKTELAKRMAGLLDNAKSAKTTRPL